MEKLQTLLKLAQDMQTEITGILESQTPLEQFLLESNGNILTIRLSEIDREDHNLYSQMGNIFPNYPAAEKASDAYRKFHRLWQSAERYNGPNLPTDWIIAKDKNNWYYPANVGPHIFGAITFTIEAAEELCQMLNSGEIKL